MQEKSQQLQENIFLHLLPIFLHFVCISFRLGFTKGIQILNFLNRRCRKRVKGIMWPGADIFQNASTKGARRKIRMSGRKLQYSGWMWQQTKCRKIVVECQKMQNNNGSKGKYLLSSF